MWLRLRQIALVARDLDAVTADLHKVLGLEVCYRDPGVATFGLRNALFPVGNQFIEVVSPVREGTAGGRYLDRRGGDGGYMVICQCDDHAPRKRRIAELAIRKVLDAEGRGFSNMQLHPRDTGGSFLEIDFQAGDQSPDGPWEPAGKNWKAAVRTEVVRAIAAAELQSPDPAALAARWSEIIEIPVGHDPAGNLCLRLENATLRFVKDADGRGEGLGGLDLVAADGGRLRDGVVNLCGMRIRTVGA
ncbi:MAG TPA: VOC family protein [Candidatus Binataceae bacterium]|nr:VOC family protein [Candidatus Binataceae bacterium]